MTTRTLRPLLGGAILCLILPISAQAQTELLVNGSFDNQLYTTDSFSMVPGGVAMPGMSNVDTTFGLNGAHPSIPGWGTTVFSTTDSVPIIEIWNGTFSSPSQGPTPYHGPQYAEMNSHAGGTLIQQVSNVAPGSSLYLSFAHSDRGGDALTSTMRVTLFDLGANGTFDSVLATPGSPTPTLGGDDTFLVDQTIGPTLYNSGATPIINNWSFYEFQTSAATNNNMVLTFQSVTSGSLGNFLDDVSLNTTSANVPEPGSLALLGLAAPILMRLRRR